MSVFTKLAENFESTVGHMIMEYHCMNKHQDGEDALRMLCERLGVKLDNDAIQRNIDKISAILAEKE